MAERLKQEAIGLDPEGRGVILDPLGVVVGGDPQFYPKRLKPIFELLDPRRGELNRIGVEGVVEVG